MTETATTFRITRLRRLVKRIETEAKKEARPMSKERSSSFGGYTRRGNWMQSLWALGKPGKRKIKGKDGTEYRAMLRSASCGSAFCAAGDTVLAAGDRLLVSASNLDWVRGEIVSFDFAQDAQGNITSIESRARDLLGITPAEANDLFAPFNKVEDIRRIAERIAAKRGKTL